MSWKLVEPFDWCVGFKASANGRMRSHSTVRTRRASRGGCQTVNRCEMSAPLAARLMRDACILQVLLPKAQRWMRHLVDGRMKITGNDEVARFSHSIICTSFETCHVYDVETVPIVTSVALVSACRTATCLFWRLERRCNQITWGSAKSSSGAGGSNLVDKNLLTGSWSTYRSAKKV